MKEFTEKLNRLKKHCERCIETGYPKTIREEHKFTLELISRYKNQKKQLNKIKGWIINNNHICPYEDCNTTCPSCEQCRTEFIEEKL